MVTSINSYSIKLSMDASGFVDATKVSRSEARQLIKEIEGAQDPMEKFAAQQARWKKQLESGALSQEGYNRLIAANKPEVMSMTAALGPAAIAIGAVGAALTATVGAGVGFISWMRDTQNSIDDTADAAERLGLSFTQLGSLKFGFAEGGGVDEKTVEDTIKKLQVNVAKAVDGDQGLRDSFAKLGVDASTLMADGPQQAMLKIAAGMENIGDLGERMKISMELFGKSGADLASTLGKGADALQEAFEFQQKWASLTDAQVAGVGNLNDDFGRIATIISGTVNKVAAELAPAFEIVTNSILDGAEGMDGVDVAIKNGVTTATILVGVFMDGLEILSEIAKRWEAINKFDFAAATASLDPGVLDFDKARSALEELEKNREKARIAGDEARRKREAENHARVLEETKAEVKAKEDAAKKLADEEKRLREQAERENRKAAEDALKNAEKYFEDERKRQMKLREDVAKGPGAGMEAGSAEAARFMAEQANAAIAEATVGVDAKPTDEQLVEQAKIQVEIARAAKVKQDEMVSKLQGVTDAIKDNGWEAV